MAVRSKKQADDAHGFWERPEPAVRPAPVRLSRERIISAAIEIADGEGLGAVSLRKVGAALNAGPMRLYGYLTSKEELLAMMVDAIHAEMVTAGPVGGDWRSALRILANRMRNTARRHPWFVDLLGGRPHQGPGALAHLEMSLAVLSGTPGFDSIDTVLQATRTFNAYVIGAIRSEAAELRAERESGMDEEQWQEATGSYMSRMIATGRYPTIEKVVRDATHPSADVIFEQGLDCIFDGIAARWVERVAGRVREADAEG